MADNNLNFKIGATYDDVSVKAAMARIKNSAAEAAAQIQKSFGSISINPSGQMVERGATGKFVGRRPVTFFDRPGFTMKESSPALMLSGPGRDKWGQLLAKPKQSLYSRMQQWGAENAPHGTKDAGKYWLGQGLQGMKSAGSTFAKSSGLNFATSIVSSLVRSAVISGLFVAVMRINQAFQTLTMSIKTAVINWGNLNLEGNKSAAIFATNNEKVSTFANLNRDVAAIYTKQFAAITRISTLTGTNAEEIQKSFGTAAQAGMDYTSAEKFVELMSKMQKINIGTQLTEVSEGLIQMSTMFGVSEKNILGFADSIQKAVNMSVTGFSDFFNAMSYAAPMAISAFGESEQTFTDMAASIAALSQSGVMGSRAGTAVRSLISSIASPTPRLESVFAKYGVNQYEYGSKSYTATQKGMRNRKEYNELAKTKEYDKAIMRGDYAEAANIKAAREANPEIKKLDEAFNELNKTMDISETELSSFYDILVELKDKVPEDVLMRALRVRSGSAASLLIQRIDLIKKYRTEIEKTKDLSLKGQSLIESSFMTIKTSSVTQAFLEVKNAVLNIWNQLIETIFGKNDQLVVTIDNIKKGLASFLEEIKKPENQKKIQEWFENATESLKAGVAWLSTELPKILAGDKTSIQSLKDKLNETFKGVINDNKENFKKIGSFIFIGIKMQVKAMTELIKGGFEAAFSDPKIWDGMIRILVNALTGAVIGAIAGGLAGFAIGNLIAPGVGGIAGAFQGAGIGAGIGATIGTGVGITKVASQDIYDQIHASIVETMAAKGAAPWLGGALDALEGAFTGSQESQISSKTKEKAAHGEELLSAAQEYNKTLALQSGGKFINGIWTEIQDKGIEHTDKLIKIAKHNMIRLKMQDKEIQELTGEIDNRNWRKVTGAK